MVIDYYRKFSKVSKFIPSITKTNLIGLLGTEIETGTIIDTDAIKLLKQNYPMLSFSMICHNDVLSISERYNLILNSLKKMRPVIVVYNPMHIIFRTEGPGHAGVVIAATDEYLILNNSWYGPNHYILKDRFIESWEIECYRMIFIEPSIQERLSTNAPG
jgi:hypothetical protein